MQCHTTQRGNILFLILLAVFLFAALSYAVTSSIRGDGSDVSREKTKADVAALMNTISLFESGLQRFMLVQNLSLKDVDFYGIQYGNSPFCSVATCDLLQAGGGGLVLNWPLEWRDMVNSTSVYTTQTTPLARALYFTKLYGVGADDKHDLILKITGLRYDMCVEINRQFGAAVTNATADLDNTNYFHYTATDVDESNTTTGLVANRGIRTWCFERNTGTYGSYFYSVLLAR